MRLTVNLVVSDKFHVIAHASQALDLMRRAEQKRDPALKGCGLPLLKDSRQLNVATRADLDSLIGQITTQRSARAWAYREQLREIPNCKQINVVRRMLRRWRTNVARSKVEPM